MLWITNFTRSPRYFALHWSFLTRRVNSVHWTRREKRGTRNNVHAVKIIHWSRFRFSVYLQGLSRWISQLVHHFILVIYKLLKNKENIQCFRTSVFKAKFIVTEVDSRNSRIDPGLMYNNSVRLADWLLLKFYYEQNKLSIVWFFFVIIIII